MRAILGEEGRGARDKVPVFGILNQKGVPDHGREKC